MDNLNKYAITVDTEFFDLLGLSYSLRKYDKSFVNKIRKFVFRVDSITACALVVCIPAPLVSRLADDDDFLTYIVRFIKMHTVDTLHEMIYVRYNREMNRLKLHMGPNHYDGVTSIFQEARQRIMVSGDVK